MHHTSHQTSHEKEPGKDTAKDPVCGMTVRKEEAIHRSYNGQEYYFCSERCLQAFEDNRNKPVL
ncbi:Copper-transporting P-type ATPase [Calderihabitans maritimus]|uniref:Copper-transporting P-type ATPase n=2 Tax=Calderihabitans maritimus TaxID=1246530 RepID=A0A1Z5HWU1_9FIRM|nr:Copper-transporting P-type ATPase [Calderihabitans maritimus]